MFSEDEAFAPMLKLLIATQKSTPEPEVAASQAMHQIDVDNRRNAPSGIMAPPPAFMPSREVQESDGHGALYIEQLPFNNWGHSVSNTPSTTWQIRTRQGVQNLVLWAAKHKKRVRVAGFRHSWT